MGIVRLRTHAMEISFSYETCCDITLLIKHTETLLRKKDCCIYSLLLVTNKGLLYLFIYIFFNPIFYLQAAVIHKQIGRKRRRLVEERSLVPLRK
jgi:hypothetical protein